MEKLDNKEIKASIMEGYIQNNKSLWNGWAKINSKSSFYNLDGFKAGQCSLKNIEINELSDIKGKSLLHLQCHFGLDTLSWARRGANVTGIDFSNEAINIAKSLSTELNIPANFICADIYDLAKVLEGKYDVVFTSYGVLDWLFNLNKWAEIIAHFLKPGGIFYIIEFHPLTNMFDHTWKELNSPYFQGNEPVQNIENGSYADNEANFSHISYGWPHTLGEIISAIRKEGLILDYLNEFPFSSYNCFPNLEEISKDQFSLKDNKNTIPLMFSIKAKYIPNLKLEC